MAKIGELGEQVIGFWLEQKKYQILYNQWRCRWGEIDIIALEKNTSNLIFVEVKTRKSYNWDHNSLFSINNLKQEKIIWTAELFLAKNHNYNCYNCRFDVALVNYKNDRNSLTNYTNNFKVLNNKILYQGYEFTIYKYLENAF